MLLVGESFSNAVLTLQKVGTEEKIGCTLNK